MSQGSHLPVLLDAAVDGLNVRADGVYLDCTFGCGGHSRQILARLGRRGRLLAMDRDHATFLYAGFDYPRLREHDTYFNLLYALVEASITAGVKVLDFGQLSSDAKTRMGARLSEVFAYAKGRGFPLAPVVTYLGHQLYPPHPMPVRHVFK